MLLTLTGAVLFLLKIYKLGSIAVVLNLLMGKPTNLYLLISPVLSISLLRRNMFYRKEKLRQ